MMIRKAVVGDLVEIINLIDTEFTKAGFGFVNKAQIETETRKGRVYIAVDDTTIIGCRIGRDTLWNLVVSKDRRNEGIGRALVEYIRPGTIRVKNTPVGHLSKKQKEEFPDPTMFYEHLGYELWGKSFPKNFWQRAGAEAKFHSKGDTAHISIYKDTQRLLFHEITNND